MDTYIAKSTRTYVFGKEKTKKIVYLYENQEVSAEDLAILTPAIIGAHLYKKGEAPEIKEIKPKKPKE
jgi:hypothetical protein